MKFTYFRLKGILRNSSTKDLSNDPSKEMSRSNSTKGILRNNSIKGISRNDSTTKGISRNESIKEISIIENRRSSKRQSRTLSAKGIQRHSSGKKLTHLLASSEISKEYDQSKVNRLVSPNK